MSTRPDPSGRPDPRRRPDPRGRPDLRRSRAAGLLLGFAVDRVLGDPRRWHPVAGFGRLASSSERVLHADARAPGVVYTALLVGGTAGLGVAVERATRGRPLLHAGATALATWTVLGGRTLEREALAVHALLDAGDLPAARERLTHLVGRDPTGLDAGEVARAVVESVAENTSDAVTAPLVWGAVGGVPALLAHRAANTLDAMVGHRNERYERFGWASARLDDVLGLPGSRLGALCVLVAAPAGARDAWEAWRRDARAHPSPNAGVVEASFAGSLGVTLGGTNRYGDRVEARPTMGEGRPVHSADVPRATALARRAGWVAVLAAAGLSRRWSSAPGRPGPSARTPRRRRTTPRRHRGGPRPRRPRR
ncbi:cobalamin biosynthesis protein [Nocardioides sp. SOB77]|uniref:Cobalamin biosynthesis protein CobD n=1 Tax=Nocardioides oceani TaxID=3058369 RepID=A0ABT8FD51_9ACTN|nr:cobalamin biosynthesis protein [Nocardioides oceani]MDN4172612.1 cobalamin biosynthesis protein [Nocardioides oceani]